MALSNKQILEEMRKKDIIIYPFKKQNLATSSYDVTLGEWFFRKQPPKYNHSLFNIYSKEHVDHVWGTNDPQKAVIAKEAFKKYRFKWDGIRPTDRVILLRPGEMILAHTEEFIGGRNHITTMMKARSSMGRVSITVCKCAGWGDVGYINRWTMEIKNESDEYIIPLVVGRRIAQLVFFETGPIINVRENYANSGKYSSSEDLKILVKKWKPQDMIPKLYLDRDIKKRK
jgi:dCTP deaminase